MSKHSQPVAFETPEAFFYHILFVSLLCLTILLTGCASEETRPEIDAEPVELLPEDDPVMVMGRQVFMGNCVVCHQANGQGIPGVYPPLADAEAWITGDPERVIKIVLHGMQGELTISGITYNQVMTPFRHLSDQEIAAVVTYARQSWGNQASVVPEALVAEIRAATTDRTTSWDAAELQ